MARRYQLTSGAIVKDGIALKLDMAFRRVCTSRPAFRSGPAHEVVQLGGSCHVRPRSMYIHDGNSPVSGDFVYILFDYYRHYIFDRIGSQSNCLSNLDPAIRANIPTAISRYASPWNDGYVPTRSKVWVYIRLASWAEPRRPGSVSLRCNESRHALSSLTFISAECSGCTYSRVHSVIYKREDGKIKLYSVQWKVSGLWEESWR